jgi:hypothetical protein
MQERGEKQGKGRQLKVCSVDVRQQLTQRPNDAKNMFYL